MFMSLHWSSFMKQRIFFSFTVVARLGFFISIQKTNDVCRYFVIVNTFDVWACRRSDQFQFNYWVPSWEKEFVVTLTNFPWIFLSKSVCEMDSRNAPLPSFRVPLDLIWRSPRHSYSHRLHFSDIGRCVMPSLHFIIKEPRREQSPFERPSSFTTGAPFSRNWNINSCHRSMTICRHTLLTPLVFHTRVEEEFCHDFPPFRYEKIHLRFYETAVLTFPNTSNTHMLKMKWNQTRTIVEQKRKIKKIFRKN